MGCLLGLLFFNPNSGKKYNVELEIYSGNTILK